MNRIYTDTAHFRAPFDTANISFAGIGDVSTHWPRGRSYHSVHDYRAPYRAGYYQSGALRGPEVSEAAMTGGQKTMIVVFILGSIALGLWGDHLRK